MLSNLNAIIYKKNIEIDGCEYFKDLDDFLENSSKDYGTVYIIGINPVTMDVIINALLASICAHKVVFNIEPNNNIVGMLRTLGFDVSATYDEYNYISSQRDLVNIDNTCLGKYETKIKESLLNGMDSTLNAVQDLTALTRGEKGYFEFNEDTVKIGETIEVFTNTIKEYLNNNVFARNEPLIGFVRHLSNKLKDVSVRESRKGIEISNLSETNSKLMQDIEKLKNELSVLKQSVRFNHFATFNIDRTKTDTKVLYIREYSHCPFLMSFLINYRMFLWNNKISNGLVVVGSKSELDTQDTVMLGDNNIHTFDAGQSANTPFILVEEPSNAVWSFVLNNLNTNLMIILDKTGSNTPVVNVDKKSGINLAAVGSRREIIRFELDADNLITSITPRKARYCIPLLDFKGGDAKIRSVMYLQNCSHMYTEISKRVRVIR